MNIDSQARVWLCRFPRIFFCFSHAGVWYIANMAFSIKSYLCYFPTAPQPLVASHTVSNRIVRTIASFKTTMHVGTSCIFRHQVPEHCTPSTQTTRNNFQHGGHSLLRILHPHCQSSRRSAKHCVPRDSPFPTSPLAPLHTHLSSRAAQQHWRGRRFPTSLLVVAFVHAFRLENFQEIVMFVSAAQRRPRARPGTFLRTGRRYVEIVPGVKSKRCGRFLRIRRGPPPLTRPAHRPPSSTGEPPKATRPRKRAGCPLGQSRST